MHVSLFARAAFFLVLAVLLFFSACGGYYYITPVLNDTGLSSAIDTTGVYTDSNICMTVHLWGGDAQGSSTVVQAQGLYVFARVESTIPFTVNLGDPYIISGMDTLAPNMLSVYQKDIGDVRYRLVETVNGYVDDPIAPISYEFPTGSVRFEMRFNSFHHDRTAGYYTHSGRVALHYPIKLNLGSVQCSDKRLVLRELWFDATTSLPDSARAITRALRAN